MRMWALGCHVSVGERVVNDWPERCTATTRKGTRCRKRAAEGCDECIHHGGWSQDDTPVGAESSTIVVVIDAKGREHQILLRPEMTHSLIDAEGNLLKFVDGQLQRVEDDPA